MESLDARHIALYLLCIPAAEAAEANERLDSTATPEDVTNAMWSIGTKWPGRGKLIVQFNAGQEHEKNWFPFDFVCILCHESFHSLMLGFPFVC